MVEIISPQKTVTARKPHICSWCGEEIPKEEKYSVGVYKFDGQIYAWKNHFKCGELVSKLKMEGDYGVTEEDFHESIREEFSRIWIEIDNDHYESKEFVIPSFKEQVKFVYKHRCDGN